MSRVPITTWNNTAIKPIITTSDAEIAAIAPQAIPALASSSIKEIRTNVTD